MYREIKNFIDNYARDGMPDNRALENYLVCETNENISALKNELTGIKNGQGYPSHLDAIVGKSRQIMHHTYQEWAKMMLLWLAEVKK